MSDSVVMIINVNNVILFKMMSYSLNLSLLFILNGFFLTKLW